MRSLTHTAHAQVPKGETLELGTEKYDALEAKGLNLIGKTGFVLVAGGLGERLGYNGIKVELPTETCTSMCYLEYYITTILSIQAKVRRGAARSEATS